MDNNYPTLTEDDSDLDLDTLLAWVDETEPGFEDDTVELELPE